MYNCNASIYFNKQCLKKKLTPAYAKITIPNTSPAHIFTQQKVTALRIKDEIKFLHSKKQKLNFQIYHLHLTLANEWNNLWQHIQHTIDNKLQREIQARYLKLDNKLKKLIQSQHTIPHISQDFHPRVINNTEITFTDNEMTLLQKGPKYNLHTKKKNWIQNLALETETAISQLPPTDRDVYRKLAAERINTLLQNNNPRTTQHTHPETKTIKSIQTKLKHNEATITRADKSNSLVILPIKQYDAKIQDFIENNEFQSTTKDPTRHFQTQVRDTVNNSKTLIPRDSKWKYTNMNPSAPTIKGLIKIHKPGQPIRPVVNWRNAPAYKLAKALTHQIKQLAPLPHTYNINNTTDLMEKLKNTQNLPHYSLASLDISNLYTNIPILDTRNIISDTLEHSQLDLQTRQELMRWYDVITHQNYFASNDKILIQEDGLAMGAPTSGLLAEFFLQHLEKTHIPHLTEKHKITRYFRYVDDILIVYDSNSSDLHNILNDFNKIHPKLNFTAEQETDSQLNFLDITIHRTPTDWKFAIYRKPTFTDTIIPHDSNHPNQHKYATVKYLYNRLNTYDLQGDHYKTETTTIQNILQNNGFPFHPPTPRPTPYNNNKQPSNTHTITPNPKWAIFT
jgi:hypothetical protein